MQDYNQSLQKKKRRRKAKIILTIFTVLLVGGGGGLLYTIYFTNVFRFSSIVLNGASVITKEDLFPGSIMPYLFGKVEVTNLLVAKIVVHKNILQKTLVLDVEERKPFGIWCGVYDSATPVIVSTSASSQESSSSTLSTGTFTKISTDLDTKDQTANCFWFDVDGLLFAKAPASSGILVKSIYETNGRALEAGSYLLPKTLLNRIFSIFDVLDKSEVRIVKYILPDLKYQEIHAVTSNGAILYFSLRLDPNFIKDPLLSLKPKLNEIKYVDFRSENKVFYQ
ncbi:MAG: hypothetical protein Q8L47_01390 [bacterium]|nr:hypothetical protein [bacterium]